jgi:hypothetical protein
MLLALPGHFKYDLAIPVTEHWLFIFQEHHVPNMVVGDSRLSRKTRRSVLAPSDDFKKYI